MKRREFLSVTALAAAATAGVTTQLGGPALAAPPPGRGWQGKVQTGFDVLAASHYELVAGKKLGIISNPTAVVHDLTHEVDVMHASPDVNLTAVFGPEHGFRGTSQAGGAEGFYTDPQTGLPVYNLYGGDADATTELVGKSGVQVLSFDIQDVGARFYTYIWTMYYGIVAAARLGIPFLVLDRPNPLGGVAPKGPIMHPNEETFVGLKPIAQQHAMTAGELAQLFNAQFVPDDAGGKKADLTVVQTRNWRRGQYFDETGLQWVMPSPNMPTLDTALVYPGLGMFEGTNFSEGRGTTRPFELIGAPYADYHWAEALNEENLPGARFREQYSTPTFNKYTGEVCAGVQCYVTDRDSFDAIRTAVTMFVTAKRLYPKDFSWHGPGRNPLWIDILSGSDWIRTSVDAGRTTDEIVAGWQGELAQFAALRKKYLIY